MIISQVQQNTLDELVKTGCGRAAELMSMLMGKPVLLETPRVSFHALDELSAHLEDISPHEVATVHQVFGGSISGDALLVLDYKGASILVDLLSGGPGIERTLTASDREAILEVGNILLNACAGSLAAWLNARLTFTAPRLRLDSLDNLLAALAGGRERIHHALLARTRFQIARGGVPGCVVVVMRAESLEVLFEAMSRGEATSR